MSKQNTKFTKISDIRYDISDFNFYKKGQATMFHIKAVNKLLNIAYVR